MAKPRETFVLARGDYRNQTREGAAGRAGHAAAAAEGCAAQPADAGEVAGRSGASAHRARGGQSLLADVLRHGIVKTQEDFGVQGEPPVHPELLDWLATEFIRTGWDVRAMQRLIVTSATYRQSSKVTPALLDKDPENRLLARGPRMRLPAEMIRDTALAVSGLLNGEIGGPSVLPYQPAGCGRRWRSARASRRRRTSRATARTSTGAACTPSGSAPCRPRRWRRSTRRTARSARRGAR